LLDIAIGTIGGDDVALGNIRSRLTPLEFSRSYRSPPISTMTISWTSRSWTMGSITSLLP